MTLKLKYPHGWESASSERWKARTPEQHAQDERERIAQAWTGKHKPPTKLPTLYQGRPWQVIRDMTGHSCSSCGEHYDDPQQDHTFSCPHWQDRDECGIYRAYTIALESMPTPVPSPVQLKAKRTRKPKAAPTADATARIAELEAEASRLREQLAAALRSAPEPDAVPVVNPTLPANLSIEPWTRDDGAEYVTLTRTNRRGHVKRFAVPRESADAVARALMTI